MNVKPVTAVVEKWTIPTYPAPAAEEMPMYAEFRQHQGTSGNPYPNRVVSKVDREHRADKEYDVIRLENEYIRVAVIPELGGRVFEAYDKKTGYDFLYRQHVIKPALIGAFGSWISGGIEFNWPFHHRPSTFMPVDYTLETEEDGTAIAWLSENDPTDRTKGMVGIVLRPDTSYFETRVKVTNRTATEHSFLWWENGAVRVHEGYQLIFPPDVTWAHHHYDRSHVTFPIAQGQYGSEKFEKPTDISWHKSTQHGNSYFAAPSKFDFFGGYDHVKGCGVIHVANHHVAPGKKMFTWGYGHHADNWEDALTDNDGPYAELMAGSYTDDQPDFTWLAPYETKCFSQFWYPTKAVKYVTYATLDGGFSIDRNGAESKIRLITTKVFENAKLTVKDGCKTVLEETVTIAPSDCLEFDIALSDEKYTVIFTGACGKEILNYTEITPDYVHIPEDNKGIPTPEKLSSAQDLFIAGLHIDQYRDPVYKPDQYYTRALKYDPNFLPALIGMGEYSYRTAKYEEAIKYLDKAMTVQNRYNTNPKDGTVAYLTGLTLFAQGKYDEAYDIFYKASWSANAIAKSMSFIAAIDCRRGEFAKMKGHAAEALAKEAAHPIAGPYAAVACWKLGNKECAVSKLDAILAFDPLNQLARFIRVKVAGTCPKEFFESLNSDPSQTCLDIAFDLMAAGLYEETVSLFEDLKKYRGASAMALYTLAYAYKKICECAKAAEVCKEAAVDNIVKVFPYRLGEIDVLETALKINPEDGTAAYLLACVLYDKKHFECAAKLWEDAIKYSPDFYIPYRNLAVAYYSHLNRADEAVALLKKAVELKKNDSQLLNEVSFVMAHTGVSGLERAEYLEKNKPEVVSDDLTIEIVKAYNAAGQYDKALELLLGHNFVPGEGGEFAIAEPYMFGRFAAGRKALAAGKYEEALGYFDASLKIPENLHAGFWNDSVKVPFLYYKAEALTKLGRKEEADAIIKEIMGYNNAGMWNMGGEFTYFSALAMKLSGEELRAQKVMRDAILGWEKQLKSEDGGIHAATSFYLCYYGDGIKEKEARLYNMLGYGMLYNGDKEKAKEYFIKSLELNPDNTKCAFELSMM